MTIHTHRNGHWLPRDPQLTQSWLDQLIKSVDSLSPRQLKPELQQFQGLIEKDVSLKILVSLMFNEIPKRPPYNNDPNMKPQVRDYMHMLQLVDHIVDSAPKWSPRASNTELIGSPISAILEWPINTYSGNAFFLRRDVNEQLAKILGRWAKYMNSPDSVSVLTDAPDGWLSKEAVSAMIVQANNGVFDYTFEQLYICDPTAPYYGFTSWDDFFTRKFHEGVRPLTVEGLSHLFTKPASDMSSSISRQPRTIPQNAALIYNACESCPVFLRRGADVRESAPFWLKGQPYSLGDMLNHDGLTSRFIGGTVYQAYLSALSYHRWHSPVSGTIVKALRISGSYFSANYFQGFANTPGTPDPIAPGNSQAYIAEVAARAVIFIEADDARIGLMGFVAVGMCEVSSNEITVRGGQRVGAGDELGMFHFGGSTHCLLFRKGVEVDFALEPNHGSGYDPPPRYNLPLRSAIAVVRTG